MKNLIMLTVLSVMLTACNRDELEDGSKERWLYNTWYRQPDNAKVEITEDKITYNNLVSYDYELDGMYLKVDTREFGILPMEIQELSRKKLVLDEVTYIR